MSFKLQPEPHLFPDIREAADALAVYVKEWGGYLQYDIRVVRLDLSKAFDGFHIRAKDFDGFGVAYIGPET